MCGVDARGLADLGLEAGLLADLAQHRVPGVLAVVEPAAGQRPELVPGDVGREPAEQDLVVAQDDGVRADPLAPRQPGHQPFE